MQPEMSFHHQEQFHCKTPDYLQVDDFFFQLPNDQDHFPFFSINKRESLYNLEDDHSAFHDVRFKGDLVLFPMSALEIDLGHDGEQKNHEEIHKQTLNVSSDQNQEKRFNQTQESSRIQNETNQPYDSDSEISEYFKNIQHIQRKSQKSRKIRKDQKTKKSSSSTSDQESQASSKKPLTYSPFHNFQKYLNNILQNVIQMPTNTTQDPVLEIATHIWQQYVSSSIKTRKILHIIFHTNINDQILKKQMKTSVIAKVMKKYDEDEVSQAKALLNKLAIAQLTTQKIIQYLKSTHIRNKQAVLKYTLDFKSELQRECIKRRVNNFNLTN